VRMMRGFCDETGCDGDGQGVRLRARGENPRMSLL
jgi:hypothetical protein